jgi:hypothetical protein
MHVMDETDATDPLGPEAVRDAHGRFVPGRSGNPEGKKPGILNRATALKTALRDGEDEGAARVIIERAVRGDGVAARFLIGRLEPRPRGRPVTIDVPENAGPGGVIAAYDATLAALIAGEITPDEALTVGRFLAQRVKLIRA